jgi:hypothetical protein
MKPFISTSFYGYFKYFLGAFLIASPWIFNLVDISSAALLIPIYFGWLQLIMNVFADTEASPLRHFPIQMYMVADIIMGFFLLVSPYLYGFGSRNNVYWPEILMGGLLMFLGFFTKKSPFTTGVHKTPQVGQLTSLDSQEGRLNI